VIRWVVGAAAAACAFSLCFVVGLLVTFPATEITDRLRAEVERASKGELRMELGDVDPWWLGVGATDVQLYSVSKVRTDPPPEPELVFFSERVRVRAALLSLLLRQPRALGTVAVGQGELDFDVAVALVEKGPPEPVAVHVAAQDFPVVELLGLAGLAGVEGEGTIDLTLDLDAPEGMRTATGSMHFSGVNLSVSKLALEDMGVPDLGAVEVTRVDIAADVAEGRARITSGVIESPMANAEIGGEITLRDDLHRSMLRLDVTVDFGDTLEKLAAAFAKDALGTDQKYHWTCSGTLNRLPPTCRAVRSKTSGATSSSRANGAGLYGQDGPPSTGRVDDDVSRKLRDEAIERVRNRRRDAAANGPTSSSGGSALPPGDPLPEDDFDLVEPDDAFGDDDWDFGEAEEE
jgi:type II secretion system protein N